MSPGAPGHARERALEILLRVAEGAWASRLLESTDDLEPRDLALVHEIVMGVLRWRAWLDSRIERRLRKPLEDLQAAVRESLRIGAYQILFLDRVPAHAAVNGSVTLARRSAGRGAAGLVNAVLRRLAEEEAGTAVGRREEGGPPAAATPRTNLDPSPRPEALASLLAIEYSHPRWMVARALARFGEAEARAWLAANNRTPKNALRPNPLHAGADRIAALLSTEGIETVPGRFAPGSLLVTDGRPQRSSLFAQGAFWIQDEASQMIPLLFPAPRDGLTGDFCAAPGGKTLVLATDPGSPGARIVALDRHPHRVAALVSRVRRIAPGRIAALAGDLAAAPPFGSETFARVMVDAPCSGTGVLRRHPEIRWKRAPGDLAGFADLQGKLLDQAYRFLLPGGYLLYAVCSVEPEEGDEVVDGFLSRSGALSEDLRSHLAQGPVRDAAGNDGRWRTYPHRQECDGFYAALMRKPGAG